MRGGYALTRDQLVDYLLHREQAMDIKKTPVVKMLIRGLITRMSFEDPDGNPTFNLEAFVDEMVGTLYIFELRLNALERGEPVPHEGVPVPPSP